jgi:hypothetical protein
MFRYVCTSIFSRLSLYRGNIARTKFVATTTLGLLLFPLAAFAQQMYPPIKGGGLQSFWNEDAYTPKVWRGSTHIRQGASAYRLLNNFGSPVLGEDNCDPLLLFVAKAQNASLDPADEERCALLEFRLHSNSVGDKRNTGNVFDRREILAEFKQKLATRIQELRAAERFYIRSFFVEVSPYDLEKKQFIFRYTFPFYGLKVQGLGLKEGGFYIPIGADEEVARKIEVARQNRIGQVARIHTPMNELHFTVLDAFLQGSRSQPERVLQVKVVASRLAIELPDGNVSNLGMGQVPAAK